MVKAIRTHTLRQPLKSHTEAPAPKGKGRHKGEASASRRNKIVTNQLAAAKATKKENTVPKSKTPAVEKPAPKGKGKKAVTPAPKTVKAESNGDAPKAPRAKEKGLRGRQVDFLTVLSKLKDGHLGLSRKELVEKVGCHPTNVTANALGDVGAEARAKREEKTGYPSLITLGYVAVVEHVPAQGDAGPEGKGARLYKITAKGRKALAEHNGK